jgi:hypothetical protein
VPVRESWLTSALQVQDVLIAFVAGWMAEREPGRRSKWINAGRPSARR